MRAPTDSISSLHVDKLRAHHRSPIMQITPETAEALAAVAREYPEAGKAIKAALYKFAEGISGPSVQVDTITYDFGITESLQTDFSTIYAVLAVNQSTEALYVVPSAALAPAGLRVTATGVSWMNLFAIDGGLITLDVAGGWAGGNVIHFITFGA